MPDPKKAKDDDEKRELELELQMQQSLMDQALALLTAKDASLERMGAGKEERHAALSDAAAALDGLNVNDVDVDAMQRRQPEKWRQLGSEGYAVFARGEHPLSLPTPDSVNNETALFNITNHGHDANGDAKAAPASVKGRRTHGRKAKGSKQNDPTAPDAPWVAPLDAAVAEWLGSLNWMATTTQGTRRVVDTHALRAGVDGNGLPATTPKQKPLHADSCIPDSHWHLRAPWGDAHLAMIIALQDNTKLHIYPFGRGGEEIIIALNAGDVLIFRGDLIHAGAEYTGRNVRIHMYLDSSAAPELRDPNRTYVVDKDDYGEDNPKAHWLL